MMTSTCANHAVSMLAAAFLGWGVFAAENSKAAELLMHLDLPPGELYSSGPGDASPAAIQPITGGPLGAFAGNDYLLVKTGTVQNGGQAYGGVRFPMPDTYLNTPVPHFYRLSFALKSGPFGPPMYDVRISNQDGLGEENTLSHTVTVDAGWLFYERETSLNAAMLSNGHPNIPRTTLFFWTDSVNGGPNQTFYIDAVRLLEFSAADFDADGDVDGDDFLVWQGGFGSGDAHADGDADGDGNVDGDDFLLWQSQFGSGSGSSANSAVPEPASGVRALAARSHRRNRCATKSRKVGYGQAARS